ncbi:hypothetical protein GCM10009865_16400 [Aeromicrobium ponti]
MQKTADGIDKLGELEDEIENDVFIFEFRFKCDRGRAGGDD